MNTLMLASLWPCLILISLYKQLAPHLNIGVHKSNTVCDFDTIWALAAAIITLSISSTIGIMDKKYFN